MAISSLLINSSIDASAAKGKLLEDIKSALLDKKVEQTLVNQVIADFSNTDLSNWKFAYKDSQLIIYPVNQTGSTGEIGFLFLTILN